MDLWGKLRRATQAARADLLATEASARNVTITLVASVAGSYFLLLDLDDQLAISQRTLKSREDSLAIMEARFEKGTVPRLDVHQAEIEAADSEADIARFNRLVRQAENSLSVLVGSNPRSIVRGMVLNRQMLPLDVPAGLPMTLLERRPDVFQAEEQLAAETARIGVARAARLPSVTLTADLGSASSDLDGLLSDNSESWGFFTDVFAPIFNSGQLKSAEAAQRQHPHGRGPKSWVETWRALSAAEPLRPRGAASSRSCSWPRRAARRPRRRSRRRSWPVRAPRASRPP